MDYRLDLAVGAAKPWTYTEKVDTKTEGCDTNKWTRRGNGTDHFIYSLIAPEQQHRPVFAYVESVAFELLA